LDSRLEAAEAAEHHIKPPGLHWAIVLILGLLTQGLLSLIWLLRISRWAKKADPESRATWWIAGGLLVSFLSGVFSETPDLKAVAVFMTIAGVILIQIGNFSIRGSMERYYNTVEHAGLLLGGVATFFLNAVYFQYHFNRIEKEKNASSFALNLTR
jgi:hypothetical protein